MLHFSRHKSVLLVLLTVAASCSKQGEPTPTIQLANGVSAELATVLTKHHATYQLGSTTASKATFKTPQELDSLLTAFEKSLVGAKLEISTPTKLKRGSSAVDAVTNRVIADAGTVTFSVVLPYSTKPATSSSDGSIDAVLSYTYCSADGYYRSAFLSSTSFQGTDPSTTYEALPSSQVVNVYADQIRFSFNGNFTYEVSGAGGAIVRYTQQVSFGYVVGLNDGQTIIDGDNTGCTTAPPVYVYSPPTGSNTPPPYNTQPTPYPITPPVYSPSNPNPGNNPTTPTTPINPPAGGGSGPFNTPGTGGGGGGGSDLPPTHFPGPPRTPEYPQEN